MRAKAAATQTAVGRLAEQLYFVVRQTRGIELTKDSTSKGLNLLSSNLDLYRTEDTKDGIFLLGVKDGEPIKIAANNVSEGNGVILTDHVQTDAPIGVIQFVTKYQEE